MLIGLALIAINAVITQSIIAPSQTVKLLKGSVPVVLTIVATS